MSEIREIAIEMIPVTPTIDIDIGSSPADIGFELKEGVIPEKDYEKLINRPRINSVILTGNKTSEELGLQDELPLMTRQEIRNIINQL